MISGDSLKNVYNSFVSEYPIVSIEDPFVQDDRVHYAKMTDKLGEQVHIVGDDLFVTNLVGDDLLVTNLTRVAKVIKEKFCNALLLNVNQIGSVTERIEAVKMSKQAGWGVMTSHRSGETEDTFIADLAVGISRIKTGAPCKSECLAKYNQLLSIEKELGAAAVYAGLKFPPELGAAAVYAGLKFELDIGHDEFFGSSRGMGKLIMSSSTSSLRLKDVDSVVTREGVKRRWNGRKQVGRRSSIKNQCSQVYCGA